MSMTETLDDILAEICTVYDVTGKDLADRIEAAHKREVESVAARCCSLGRLAGYGASEIKHQREVGNGAKMHEALKQILALAKARGLFEIQSLAETALAEPARNCDRFADFNEAIRSFAKERPNDKKKWDMERYAILAMWLFAEAKGESK